LRKKPSNAALPHPLLLTLQQEAVRKLGMTSDRTMRTAQSLYEGVDIGGQTIGLISYMRTDSVSLANEAVAEIRGYISDNFSADYLRPNNRPTRVRPKMRKSRMKRFVRPRSCVPLIVCANISI